MDRRYAWPTATGAAAPWQDGLVSTEVSPVEALIIVDVQRGFLEEPKAIPDAVRVVDRPSRLLRGARRATKLVDRPRVFGADTTRVPFLPADRLVRSGAGP
jgi:hypothetical protein